MVSRRSVGIDSGLIEELKGVALRRGMNVVSYLRKLINEALELERRGSYAPRALAERRVEQLLASFNFTYLPLDLITRNFRDEDLRAAREYGERLGAALKELGSNVYEVIEYLGNTSGIVIHEGDRVIVMPATGSKRLVAELIKGIAVGGGLGVVKDGEVFIVKVPEEVMKATGKLLEEGLTQRRGRRKS